MWYSLAMDTSLAAQQVRAALRSAGFREWAQGRRGWRVEADPQGGWVAVGCTLHGVKGDLQLQEYRDVLRRAGFQVKDDPLVPSVLRVTVPD
jgi:hypothetical protein